MNSIYCLLFLAGCLFLCGVDSFQIGAHGHSSHKVPTFVTFARKLHGASPTKLFHSLPEDVVSSSLKEEVPLSSQASLKQLEEEALSNLVWLEQRFNFSDGFLCKIETIYKDLLTLDQSVLVHRANWLQNRLKLNEEQLGSMIRQHPRILTCRPDTNLAPKLDYLQERLAFNAKDLSKMIQNRPSIISRSSTESLEPKLSWLQNRLHLNETKALQKYVSKVPETLGLSIDGNLEPTFKWLQQRLNLTELQIAKVCIKAPSTLVLSLDDNLMPKLDWLEQRLDLDQTQLGKMIRMAPTILHLRVDSLEQKLEWLQQRLVLDDASLKKIVIRMPTVFGYSASTNLEPTLRWLEKHLFLAQEDGIGRLIEADPTLLGFSIEKNLEPTHEFFKECIGDKAAVAMVVSNPRMLHASLERRLKPRLKQVEQLGIEIDAGCLQRMAQNTEERWYRSLDYQEKKLAKSNAKDLLW